MWLMLADRQSQTVTMDAEHFPVVYRRFKEGDPTVIKHSQLELLSSDLPSVVNHLGCQQPVAWELRVTWSNFRRKRGEKCIFFVRNRCRNEITKNFKEISTYFRIHSVFGTFLLEKYLRPRREVKVALLSLSKFISRLWAAFLWPKWSNLRLKNLTRKLQSRLHFSICYSIILFKLQGMCSALNYSIWRVSAGNLSDNRVRSVPFLDSAPYNVTCSLTPRSLLFSALLPHHLWV